MRIIVIFIVSLIGTIYFYGKVSEQEETKNWFTVEAEILDIKTYESYNVIHDVRKEYTQFNLLYAYTYNDIKYQSYQISLDGIGRLSTYEYQNLIKENNWKIGNKTFAYINPMEFSDSVLLKSSKGVNKNNWIGLVLFGVFLILAVFNLIFMTFSTH